MRGEEGKTEFQLLTREVLNEHVEEGGKKRLTDLGSFL
jgi:hypothetical protein